MPNEIVEGQATSDSDIQHDQETEQHKQNTKQGDCDKRRSTRTIRKPIRFQNEDHIDPDDMELT